MIWLAWRLHRRQVLATGIGLVLFGALIIPTGLVMRHAFDRDGLNYCVRVIGSAELVPPADPDCLNGFSTFVDEYGFWTIAAVLFLMLPLLLGLFWGAPLVSREIENGTHRFIWTQGISRRRWILTKTGLAIGVALIASTAYGLGLSWWLEPLNRAGGESRFEILFFDMQGLVPIGYTLFAVALGIAAGAWWRKVLPAMAAVLSGFVAVRGVVAFLARPHYLPARILSFRVNGDLQPNPTVGDWILHYEVRNADSSLVGDGRELCPPTDPTCVRYTGFYDWQRYQPASRFWLFQGIETGIFVALAVLLIWIAVRSLRRIA